MWVSHLNDVINVVFEQILVTQISEEIITDRQGAAWQQVYVYLERRLIAN